MSPEAQRIKIAEACGWKHYPGEEPTYGGTFKRAYWQSPKGRKNDTEWARKSVIGLPDFLHDLNAMNDAEETLDANECAEYARQLSKHHPTYCVSVLEKGAELEDIAYQTWSIIHATAEQRAEAFLRAKGIWVDDEKSI